MTAQYPVIFLTFKDIKVDSWEEAYEEFAAIISEECIRLSSNIVIKKIIMKVTVVGAGNVGATCADVIARKEFVHEVVLLDIKEGIAEGKSLDIWPATLTIIWTSRAWKACGFSMRWPPVSELSSRHGLLSFYETGSNNFGFRCGRNPHHAR